MVLPILAYGDPILKRKALEVPEGYKDLKELITNMWETMYAAKGVGLAAPQVGISIRLFIVNATPFSEDNEGEVIRPELVGFKKVFINPVITSEKGEKWKFNEGCLSIPTIREDVERKPDIHISYYDEELICHEEFYDGIRARIIQHEYDHLEGILFTDKINPLRRRLLKRKLSDISKGIVEVSYKMKFPLK